MESLLRLALLAIPVSSKDERGELGYVATKIVQVIICKAKFTLAPGVHYFSRLYISRRKRAS